MKPIECGSCRACCLRDVVKLHPKLDDLDTFDWHYEQAPSGEVFAVVDRRADGACVYLGDAGCTIHERKPVACRMFDCRVLYMETPAVRRKRRISENPTMKLVYDAARERLAGI